VCLYPGTSTLFPGLQCPANLGIYDGHRVEIRGAYVYDQRPKFSMPPSAWNCFLDSAELHDRPSSENNVLTALRRRSKQSSAFVNIFADLVDVSAATSLLLEQHGSTHWKSRNDGGGWTNNLIHRLLSWRPLIEAADDDYLSPNAQEACRLAALLYIAPIWRKFGAAPVVTTVLVQKLLVQMRLAPIEWGELGLLRAWVLVMGGLEAEDHFTFRQLTEMLGSHLRDRHVLSWDQIFPSLKAVLWIEDALGGADERLREELDQLLHIRHH
jgi:hypothetical protein